MAVDLQLPHPTGNSAREVERRDVSGLYLMKASYIPTVQMAADQEAVGLSRDHMYESKCILIIVYSVFERNY